MIVSAMWTDQKKKLAYRPLILKTLRGELFIRRAIIGRGKWYRRMVKTVSWPKTGMRYALSLKKTMYNEWEDYRRRAKLPFLEARNFWKLMGEEAKSALINYDRATTLPASEERVQLEVALSGYAPTVHLGSQRPKFPVGVAHIGKRDVAKTTIS